MTTKKNTALATTAAIIGLAAYGGSASADIWINEFHYDNSGGDANEFVEIVVSPDETTPLDQVTITFYNGANGQSYELITFDLVNLPNVFAGDVVDGYEFYYANISGIQNGGPDGMALSTSFGGVLQFISYEGTFTATNGVANGLTSVDIGVFEDGTGPDNSSVGLTGPFGSTTWALFDGSSERGPSNVATPGSLNFGQTVPAPGALAMLAVAGLMSRRRRRSESHLA